MALGVSKSFQANLKGFLNVFTDFQAVQKAVQYFPGSLQGFAGIPYGYKRTFKAFVDTSNEFSKKFQKVL